MKLKNIILGLGLSLLMNTTFAQGGLEGIVVERYYQTNAADGTNASTNSAINALATGTVVYRVYVDMAAGYKFSQLYGSSTHDFRLNTTTNFYNDPNYSTTTNPASVSLVNARKNTALIDSWFTAGGVCAGKSGVSKTEDTDGSIGNTQAVLANSPGSCYGAPINGTNAQDGLVNSTSLTAVNPNVLGITSTQLNLLDQGTGNSFLTNNGSIAALGGVRGTNASNMVLVGQFTTNGVLSFELNVQIIAANGTAENWVARNRTGNEFTSPSLIFNSTPVAGTVTASVVGICAGSSTVLTLSNSSGDIQWQRSTTSSSTGFIDIPGANSSTFTATNVTASCWFRARVSRSSCAVVNSTVRSIVVSTIPAVAGTLNAAQSTICRYSGTTLNLTGSSGVILWQRSTNYTSATPTWTNVSGQTSTSLATGVLSSSTAYRARLTSGSCQQFSNQVVVMVNLTSAVSSIAGGGDKCINSNVTLSLSSFTGSLQWQEGTSATGTFTAIPGATNSTYQIINLTSTRYFRVVSTSGICSSITSAVVEVRVRPLSVAGTISFTGASSICLGSSKTLSLPNSVGTRQWESSIDGINYFPIFGATAATYSASAPVSTYYRVKVTSSVCSTVYTSPVYITISEPALGGNIGSDVNACGSTGATLNLVGSNGSIVWQVSYTYTAAVPSWSTIAGQTSTSFSTGPFGSSRAFRAMLTSGSCVSYSNQVVVTRDPSLVSKSITSTTTSGTSALTALCTNDVTKLLNLGAGSVGNIQWQLSTDNGVTYSDIVGATTATYTSDSPVAGRNMFRVKLSNACGVVFTSAFSVFYTACGARSSEINTNVSFGAMAYPNPFADNFMLEVSASTNEMIQVNVYDMLGKLVENHQVNVSDLSTFVIGNTFVSGIYNIEVIQGTQIERLRVVKN